MKKIAFIFTLFVLFFSLDVSQARAAESPWDKKLPFKTATVTYAVKGTMSGEKIIYVKDYGRTTAEYATMTMKMFGMTQKQQEIIITTPDWVYTADLTEGTGSKQANINKYMKQEYNSLSASDQKKVRQNAQSMGISTVEGMNGTLEEEAATVLGYTCDKVSVMGTTAYTISGSDLPLKVEGDTMGVKVSQVATDIKTGSAPASKFELPKGIRFEHNAQADQMMQAQARSVIQNLVEGKNPMGNQMGQMPAQAGMPSQNQSAAGQVIEDDAQDIGRAAHQEAKDAAVDEVQEGVRTLFKSIFD